MIEPPTNCHLVTAELYDGEMVPWTIIAKVFNTFASQAYRKDKGGNKEEGELRGREKREVEFGHHEDVQEIGSEEEHLLH